MNLKFCIAAALAATVISAHPAHSQNLIQNGNFAATGGVGGYGQVIPTGGTNNAPGYSVALPGWTAPVTSSNQGAPFVFVVNPATLDTTGFPDSWDNGMRTLWGSNNGGPNTITAPPSAATSVLSLDGSYHSSPIYQVLSGLVVGNTYNVSFDWAATQWREESGATTDSVTVSLGSQSFTTNVYDLPSHGFSAWMNFTDSFTYEGGTSTVAYGGADGLTYTTVANALTLFTTGTPNGLPPGVLISNVSLNVAEPATWAILLFGVGGLAVAARRRGMAMAVARVRKRR